MTVKPRPHGVITQGYCRRLFPSSSPRNLFVGLLYSKFPKRNRATAKRVVMSVPLFCLIHQGEYDSGDWHLAKLYSLNNRNEVKNEFLQTALSCISESRIFHLPSTDKGDGNLYVYTALERDNISGLFISDLVVICFSKSNIISFGQIRTNTFSNNHYMGLTVKKLRAYIRKFCRLLCPLAKIPKHWCLIATIRREFCKGTFE